MRWSAGLTAGSFPSIPAAVSRFHGELGIHHHLQQQHSVRRPSLPPSLGAARPAQPPSGGPTWGTATGVELVSEVSQARSAGLRSEPSPRPPYALRSVCYVTLFPLLAAHRTGNHSPITRQTPGLAMGTAPVELTGSGRSRAGTGRTVSAAAG